MSSRECISSTITSIFDNVKRNWRISTNSFGSNTVLEISHLQISSLITDSTANSSYKVRWDDINIFNIDKSIKHFKGYPKYVIGLKTKIVAVQ